VKWSKYATILEYASYFALGGKKKNPLAAGASREKKTSAMRWVLYFFAVLERFMLARPFSRIAFSFSSILFPGILSL